MNIQHDITPANNWRCTTNAGTKRGAKINVSVTAVCTSMGKFNMVQCFILWYINAGYRNECNKVETEYAGRDFHSFIWDKYNKKFIEPIIRVSALNQKFTPVNNAGRDPFFIINHFPHQRQ